MRDRDGEASRTGELLCSPLSMIMVMVDGSSVPKQSRVADATPGEAQEEKNQPCPWHLLPVGNQLPLRPGLRGS